VRPLLLLLGLLAACATTPAGPAEVEFPIVIEGQRNVPEVVLRAAALRELEAFLTEGYRPADAADAADAMRGILLERGYAHGTVAFQLEEDRLRFTVEEGPRAHLGAVGFDGVEAFEERDLLTFFDFPGSDLLGSGRPLFRLAEVENAAANVERYYLLNGYLHVKVDSPAVSWVEGDTLADVTIRVSEGRRFVVTSVEFDGMDPVDLGLVDAPYHARLPVEAAARLRGRLLGEGRQFCEVDVDTQVDEDTATVALRFVVQPGPVVHLRSVHFTGQERSREKFLRRRVPIADTEAVLQELYDEGIANLHRTGLFSSVRPRIEQVGADVADLEIALKEVAARSVDLEVGYGSYELARGAVRYRDRNLFGWGRRLEVELAASVRSASAQVSVEDPYLLGERTPLEVATGYAWREEPSFDQQTIGAQIQVSRYVRGFRFSTGYRYQTDEALNAKVPIDPEEEGFIASAGLFFKMRRDTLDDVFAPTRGWVGQFGIAWSSPLLGADLDFLAWDLTLARYQPLFGRFVLLLGARFRTSQILDDRADLPIQQRYFLGGAADVRSFGQSQLGPTDNGEPRGGLTALNGTVELRHPITGSLQAGTFFDIGLVDVRAWTIDAPLGYGVGVGLRYMLPVGPIRLDVAYNPGPFFAATRRWQVHLAFGFTF